MTVCAVDRSHRDPMAVRFLFPPWLLRWGKEWGIRSEVGGERGGCW